MTLPNTASRPITGHIAPDILGFYRDGQPDYKRVADMVKLTKEDLGKISRVSKSSVRFDDAIPAAMAIRLREIANIANLVAEFFDGDVHKVALWFELPNPHLGNVSPQNNDSRRPLQAPSKLRAGIAGSGIGCHSTASLEVWLVFRPIDPDSIVDPTTSWASSH